jgi:hypothetical protein
MSRQHADEGAPELDSSDVDSMSLDGKTGNMGMAAATGLLSGAVFVKVQAFVMGKISSLRNMSRDNDSEDLDVLPEAVDVDDVQNAATSVANNAFRESARNGFGIANVPPAPPGVAESSA